MELQSFDTMYLLRIYEIPFTFDNNMYELRYLMFDVLRC